MKKVLSDSTFCFCFCLFFELVSEICLLRLGEAPEKANKENLTTLNSHRKEAGPTTQGPPHRATWGRHEGSRRPEGSSGWASWASDHGLDRNPLRKCSAGQGNSLELPIKIHFL